MSDMCEELYDPFQDQVECARYRAERDALVQAMQAVCERMEAHFLGIEGMDESPVASWARDLRAALGSLHAPVRDATASACDLTPDEAREALRWVREHGGVDELTRMFQDADNRRVELCGALGIDLDTGWSDAMAELDRRLMPDGMESSRYESGEPFVPGDDGSVEFFGDGIFNVWINGEHYHLERGECVRRPVPKVYDADGVEIHEGDRVWSTHLDEPHEWIVIDPHEYRDDSQTVLVSIGDRTGHARPEDLTHRAPVLAADGEPLEVGQTVWNEIGVGFKVEEVNPKNNSFTAIRDFDESRCDGLNPIIFTHQRPVLDAGGEMLLRGETVYNMVDGEEYRVRGFVDGVLDVCVETADGDAMTLCHDVLTHAKPEPPDSWERVRDDMEMAPKVYCEDVMRLRVGGMGLRDMCKSQKDDLVRRCKALTEKENTALKKKIAKLKKRCRVLAEWDRGE